VAVLTKVPVIQRKTHYVWLENFAGKLWVHCDVFKWNRETKKQMDQDWAQLMDMLNSDLYVLHNPIDNKPKLKFIKWYGFQFLKETTGRYGEKYQIWYRRK
jgi:hypothetical protein